MLHKLYPTLLKLLFLPNLISQFSNTPIQVFSPGAVCPASMTLAHPPTLEARLTSDNFQQ